MQSSSDVMETVELFKILGKRVTKLPAPQQDEIIETVLGMIDQSEQMNKSSALIPCQQFQGLQQQQQHQWEPGFNLTKSVSSFVLTNHGGTQLTATSLTSSPSDIV